jgi:hypothetical protein
MAPDPKRQDPDIPTQKPDIQPEPRPEEIPQQDVPGKESPPTMQLLRLASVATDRRLGPSVFSLRLPG